jgi:hypothetical protein
MILPYPVNMSIKVFIFSITSMTQVNVTILARMNVQDEKCIVSLDTYCICQVHFTLRPWKVLISWKNCGTPLYLQTFLFDQILQWNSSLIGEKIRFLWAEMAVSNLTRYEQFSDLYFVETQLKLIQDCNLESFEFN